MALSSKKSVKTLILDSGAFISGAQLSSFGPDVEYFTTPRVLAELRDKVTRQVLESFPYEIKTRSVSEAAMATVTAFAKKTGDNAVLSATDMEVIALTLMIEKELNGTKFIRSEPTMTIDSAFLSITNAASGSSSSIPLSSAPSFAQSLGAVRPFDLAAFASCDSEDTYLDQIESSSSSSSSSFSPSFPSFFDADNVHTAASPAAASSADSSSSAAAASASDSASSAASSSASSSSSSSSANAKLPGWGDDDEEETHGADEGAWITSDNYKTNSHDLVELESKAPEESKEISSIAVITTDFAMQNVIVQLGLRLISVNGLAIHTIRTMIKRCHGCFRVERDVNREFCQYCGGHTLVRVSITIDAQGRVQIKQSNRQVFWKRGTIFSIPKPKAGQIPMLLREDQLQMGRMRQLLNNKRRAEKQANRALFGDIAHSATSSLSSAAAVVANRGNLAAGRAPAAAATRSLMEASAFASEHVVAKMPDISYGHGRRNPNAQRGGGRSRRH